MSNWGEMISSFGKSINEIASEFAGVDNYAKTIYPGLKELEEEFAQTIAGSKTLMGSKLDDYAQESVRSILEKASSKNNIPEEVIEELTKSVHAKSLDGDIDNIAKKLSEYTDKSDTIAEVLKKKANAAIDSHIGDTSNLGLSTPEKVMKYPRAYFSHPDKKIQDTRIKSAVAAYAGLTVGGRYLSGGTLTSDNYGRKDIAGVPFL